VPEYVTSSPSWSVIDAGDDEHRALGQKTEHAEIDAVRGRAVHGVAPLAQRWTLSGRCSVSAWPHALCSRSAPARDLAEVLERGGEGGEARGVGRLRRLRWMQHHLALQPRML